MLRTYNSDFKLDNNGNPTGAAITTNTQALTFDATTGASTTAQITITEVVNKIDYKLNFPA